MADAYPLQWPEGMTDLMLRYAKVFARRWNCYLDDGLEMRAEVHMDHSQELLAVEFFPSDATDPWQLKPEKNDWQGMLARINEHFRIPMGTSQIPLDSMVHHVSNDSIIIIKRNQKRFWTRSLARKDADGTILKMMNLTGKDNREKSDETPEKYDPPGYHDPDEKPRNGDE